jgi:MFS superfamily sulfate permease-like transporter
MLGLAAMLSHPEAKTEPPNSPLEKLLFVIDHIDHTNKTTMTLALASLAFLIFVRSIKPRLVNRPGAKWVRFVPEILLAVVIGTGTLFHKSGFLLQLIDPAVTGIFRLDERGVDILGKVKAGHGSPLGWPLTKRAIKYSDYTVSPLSIFGPS